MYFCKFLKKKITGCLRQPAISQRICYDDFYTDELEHNRRLCFISHVHHTLTVIVFMTVSLTAFLTHKKKSWTRYVSNLGILESR